MEALARDARVSRISIAAVKGLAVQQVEAVDVGPNGVAENRRLHLVDASGRLVNGKTSMRLSLVASRLDLAAGRLALEFPEGDIVSGAIELGGPIETIFFGRPAAGRLVVGPWSGALSAWSGLDLRLAMSDEIGAANDRGPEAGVSIISSASIADLARTGGTQALDARRFRMLFEVDGVEPYAEDAWIGRDLQIGGAVVRPLGNVGRCVVTTHDPETAERDFDTLGVLATYRGDIETTEPLPFGVAGDVSTPGRVRMGDAVTVAPGSPAPS
ncbi:MAG: MOSC domain-containing protein [Actinomycetota bacterium]|nr:MOSC domain-containing protein [Actinomycetota bacterium]